MAEHIPVIEKIKQLADRMPDVSFMYDDYTRLNLMADKLRKPCEANLRADQYDLSLKDEFPLMFVILRSSGTFNRRNGNVRDYQNLQVGFVTPALDADFDGLENDGRIEWMKAIAKRFFQLYEKSGMFEYLPASIPYQDIYNLFDATVTGVYFELQVQETGGICTLPLEVYPEPIDPTQWKRDCTTCPPTAVPIDTGNGG